MASAVVIVRLASALLGLVTFITVVSTIVSDGSPFRRELLTPWMVATLIDFYVNVIPIAVWVWYKEQSWFSALIWIALLICFGSMTTCWYITLKLFQISADDPLYFVLLRKDHMRLIKNKAGTESMMG